MCWNLSLIDSWFSRSSLSPLLNADKNYEMFCFYLLLYNMMIREQIEAKMILSEVHFMLFAQPIDFCWMSLSKELFLCLKAYQV